MMVLRFKLLEEDYPVPPTTISPDLLEACESGTRLVALYYSVFHWLDSLEGANGLTQVLAEEGWAESISQSITEIDKLLGAIDPASKHGDLIDYQVVEEICEARGELTDGFVPPIENPEFILRPGFKFESAHAFVDDLYPVFQEAIVRWLRNIERLINSPHNCSKRLANSTISQELQFVIGRFTMLPILDWPGGIMQELIRESIAAEKRRKAGRCWYTLSSPIEDATLGSNSEKIKIALEFIEKNGPVKAKEIAKTLDIEVNSFHRHYASRLKKQGVRNLRGQGYVSEDFECQEERN